MKNRLKPFERSSMLAILFSFLVMTIAPPVFSASPGVDIKQLKEKSDQIAKSYAEMGWFQGTVLVRQNNKTIYENAFGYANHAHKIKNTLWTKYNLGSIIKNYTAVLVFQMVDEGLINLDDTLCLFGLGFPKAIAQKITINHLLTHQSGFKDIFTTEYNANRMGFDTIEKKLALLKDVPLLFEPGSSRKYSNYGYVVLGAVLEKVYQKTFEDLLQEKIFQPLKQKNTHFTLKENIENLSLRYSYHYDGTQKFVGVTEHPSPDGGLEADIYDVAQFYNALFLKKALISEDSLNKLKQMNRKNDHSWHAFGGGVGVSSAAEMNFQTGLEIVVLSNSDKLVAELISGRIYQFAAEGIFDPPKANAQVFTFQMYSTKGLDYFKAHFSDEYKSAGYTMFKGRVLNGLGMELLDDKKYNLAIDIFKALVAIFPKAPQAYDSLAWGFYKSGEPKNASNSFVKALSLKADFQSEYSADNYKVTKAE